MLMFHRAATEFVLCMRFLFQSKSWQVFKVGTIQSMSDVGIVITTNKATKCDCLELSSRGGKGANLYRPDTEGTSNVCYTCMLLQAGVIFNKI